MPPKKRKTSIDYALPILIGTALIIQLVGRYQAGTFRVGYFYYAWIVLRIAVPAFFLHILKIPPGRIGLHLPGCDRFIKKMIPFSALGFFSIYLVLRASPEYLAGYAHRFGFDLGSRLINFGVFTVSTLTGWEFLHRAFLLLGAAHIIEKNYGLERRQAGGIALVFVWVFEVMFHFSKPAMEALGLFLGSPLLSYITLRIGSIWPAFLLHLGIEAVFIFSI